MKTEIIGINVLQGRSSWYALLQLRKSGLWLHNVSGLDGLVRVFWFSEVKRTIYRN